VLSDSVNRKYETKHLVKARAEATQTYHHEDFKLRRDPHDGHLEREAPHGGGQRNSPWDLSQSERDWAFAKRALARGDEPEEAIRRRTDYRGDEKHTNDARYIVEKAQMELRRRPASLQPTERSPTQTNEPSHEQ